MTIVSDWHEKIPSIIAGYDKKDIANADETALFFRAIPPKSLALKGQKCEGGKQAKERLSLLLCAFGDGHVMKPLVIGKAAKPRCFKNIDMKNLPVDWYHNKKAWMTAAIMEDWLLKLNAQMMRENRKILLFLDNATSHKPMCLSNIKLVFFPPQTTSVLQPLDQGVIKAAKVYYRQKVLSRLCREMQTVSNISELVKTITVLDAVSWIASSVKSITAKCVAGCFKNAGFNLSTVDDDDFDPEDGDLVKRFGPFNA